MMLTGSGLFFKDFSLNVYKFHQILNLILHRFYNLEIVTIDVFYYGTQLLKCVGLLFYMSSSLLSFIRIRNDSSNFC